MKAVINKIIPFSSVDGPGNRTAVFLQGCNIDCKYCHNPETRKHCTGCGVCVENCPAGALSLEAAAVPTMQPPATEDSQPSTQPPVMEDSQSPMQLPPAADTASRILYDPAKCIQCDTCIHVCPHDSSPRTAWMTPEQVFEQIRKQIPFIRGITVSGGECMLEPAFLTELFTLAKAEGLTTLIDSNGTVPFCNQEELLAVTDGVMLDIKAFSEEDHKRVTGASNEVVLENAVFLAEQGKLYEVRAVIVPDLYDTEDSVRRMGEFLTPYYKKHEFRIKVIAYRPMGVREEYSHFKVPDRGYLEKLAGILKSQGFNNIIII